MSAQQTASFVVNEHYGSPLPRRGPSAQPWRLQRRQKPTPGAGPDARYLADAENFLTSDGSGEEPRLGNAAPRGPMWLDDVYSLVAQGKADDAIDILFGHVDDILSGDQVTQCNDLLRTVDLTRLDTNLLVGLLAATLPAKARLPGRPKLVARIEARLNELAPGRVARLLDGLR